MKHLSVLALILGVAVLVGCDGGGGPDKKVEEKRMDIAIRLREIFTSVKGDYTKLSPEQKKEVLDIYKGNESNAQRAWALMQNGGLSGPSSNVSGPNMQGR